MGRELDTVAEVAREFGVGWFCAHQAVIDLVTTFVDIDRGRLLDVVPGFSGVLVF